MPHNKLSIGFVVGQALQILITFRIYYRIARGFYSVPQNKSIVTQVLVIEVTH